MQQPERIFEMYPFWLLFFNAQRGLHCGGKEARQMKQRKGLKAPRGLPRRWVRGFGVCPPNQVIHAGLVEVCQYA